MFLSQTGFGSVGLNMRHAGLAGGDKCQSGNIQIASHVLNNCPAFYLLSSFNNTSIASCRKLLGKIP